MKKIFLILGLILINISCIYSQEIITELSTNSQITGQYKAKHKFKASNISIKLPFIDDFSNYTGYPDSGLWMDNYVYINTQFAIFPITIGVATFDALNDSGVIYPQAMASQFPADTLTSRPIRLDSIFQPSLKALKLSDSLYFSFYFQPAGGRGNAWERIGDAPEPQDSLVLEFYSPVLHTWSYAWSTKGIPLDSIYLKNNRYFKYVIIPVNDSANYYKDGFQFRFRNYCSLGSSTTPSMISNCDQWNIDYVYLGVNRSIYDTTFHDLTFIEKAPSFLKKYQAMPARQFQLIDVKDNLNMLLSNIDSISHSSTYKYEVRDQNGSLVHTQNCGIENISSFWTTGYQTLPGHANPPVTYNFAPVIGGNKSWYEIRHLFQEIGSNPFLFHRFENDTNSFIQRFEDYYAYDDGSAENGYGLSPAGSMLAYKFTLFQPDTLVAVEMFFNPTYNNSNQIPFFITVWNDNGAGLPGDTIFQSSLLTPVFENGLNKFHSYILDRQIKVSGTFYVGWTQTTDDNLNIGFDRNTASQDNIYYNSFGVWENSFKKGSLMIRPVFGTQYLGVNDFEKEAVIFDVFPNPLRDGNITISLQSNGKTKEKDYSLQIFDMLGRKVYQSEFKLLIDASLLQNGVYLITISNTKTKQQQVRKLIISR
ncbi:MAG: T9SS type A sorting domain-containing protein [Bacteroidetes bacterium]|nr:T9SS type A sorting domain-containing protein [Bacteroidota bacterium]